ncbi:DUF5667 domain-containing protein [Bacillus sp. CGMCC 1.16607]|uniref:DUF5667 domain-containing protein n=1 Tax=Bacillus sp. CGMCC 1.16607 TaxID=3351842 RepID=UPI00363717B2
MKKAILTTALAFTLSMGTSAFAEENGTSTSTTEEQGANVEVTDKVETVTNQETVVDSENTVEPGMTPDKFFYTFDLLMEDLKLLVTFDSQKEAELLLQFAQERLAEAEAMTAEEKKSFVEQAVTDYLALLEEAGDKVTEVITDESVAGEAKDELTNVLEETTVVTDEVTDQLDPEQQEDVATKTDQALLVAQVVQGFDVEIVKKLRQEELGYGQIAQIISLSNISGKSIEEVTKLLEESGFGQVMKELDINIHQLKQQRLVQKIGSLEASLESAQASGDTKTLAKLERQLNTLKKKNDRFLAAAGTSEQEETPDSEKSSEEGTTTTEETPVSEKSSDEDTTKTDETVNEASVLTSAEEVKGSITKTVTTAAISNQKAKGHQPTTLASSGKKEMAESSKKEDIQVVATANKVAKGQEKRDEGKKEATKKNEVIIKKESKKQAEVQKEETKKSEVVQKEESKKTEVTQKEEPKKNEESKKEKQKEEQTDATEAESSKEEAEEVKSEKQEPVEQKEKGNQDNGKNEDAHENKGNGKSEEKKGKK